MLTSTSWTFSILDSKRYQTGGDFPPGDPFPYHGGEELRIVHGLAIGVA